MKKQQMFFLISLFFFTFCNCFAQLSLSGTEPIEENFNSMGTSKTATVPQGFVVTSGTNYAFSVTTTKQSYGTNGSGMVTGSSARGIINWANGFYGTATDRALGFLMGSDYTQPCSIMLCIQNNTGKTITQLSISWHYEKYRSGTRATSWIFYTGTTGTSWSEKTEGNQSYPGDANNSTVSDPPASISKTVELGGLSIAPGTSYYFRWACTSTGGSDNTQGLGIDDLIISDFNTITAENSQSISGTGLINFNGEATGVAMNIQSISGSGNITVQKHNSAPLNSSSILLANISKYRWVISADPGITGINTQLRFYLSDIPNHGIREGASGVILYKRQTPGSGTFTEIGTLTYNNMGDGQSSDYLSMDAITGFSEFVFASDVEPLPVELTSFTYKIKEGVVTLNWSTATEVNNCGFDIERAFNNQTDRKTAEWKRIGFIPGAGNSNSPKEYSFTDDLNQTVIHPYSAGAEYSHSVRYRLKQIDNDGTFSYSEEVSVINSPPSTLNLFQNYPNPFNPVTVIGYVIPKAGFVSVKLYDATGVQIAELVKENQEAGYHKVELSADRYNLATGLYYYTLESSGYFAAKKMILLK